MEAIVLFFPALARRSSYPVRKDGGFYKYSAYKQEVREDCQGRCVYCDSHENEIGGAESMELDHFRPRKYKEHAHLVNDPANLVWSCRGCNRLKSSYWPALGLATTVRGSIGFVDPFAEDRAQYFLVQKDGTIRALKAPGEYKIRLLALNRATRRRLRELRYLKHVWLDEFSDEIHQLEHLLDSSGLSPAHKKTVERHVKWLRATRVRLAVAFFDCTLR